jgi:hypothetical protein
MRQCRNSEAVIPKKEKKHARYVRGEWVWRCSCGQVVTADKMGWVKGKFGLIVDAH